MTENSLSFPIVARPNAYLFAFEAVKNMFIWNLIGLIVILSISLVKICFTQPSRLGEVVNGLIFTIPVGNVILFVVAYFGFLVVGGQFSYVIDREFIYFRRNRNTLKKYKIIDINCINVKLFGNGYGSLVINRHLLFDIGRRRKPVAFLRCYSRLYSWLTPSIRSGSLFWHLKNPECFPEFGVFLEYKKFINIINDRRKLHEQ